MSIGNPNDNPLNFTVKVRDPKTKNFQPVYKLSEATAQTLGGVYLSDAIDDADSVAAIGVTAATPFAVQKVNANTENKIDKTTTFTIKTGNTTSVTGKFTEKTDSENAKLDFNLSSIPASAITGVLSPGNIPPVAQSVLVTVTNDSARLALDNTQVQIGDTVYVESTKKMYYVKDDTKLGSEDAFQIYVAGSAATAEALVKNGQSLTVGESKLPVYFSNGVPTKVDSKFTDIYTWYTSGTLSNAASAWNAPTIKTSDIIATNKLDLIATIQGSTAKGGQLYINAIGSSTDSPVATFANGSASSLAELYLTSGKTTTILTSGNYNTWAAAKNHNHDATYLKLSGGKVTGAITSSSSIAAAGLSSTSTLTASGAATLNSTLTVAGNATLKGTNTISGTTNMSGQLNMTNDIAFDLGSSATSGSTKAISMKGGTDYGKIYYRVDGTDLGRLVIEYGDDGDARLVFRGNNNSASKVTETYMDVNGYWSGTAASANKLNTDAGGASTPIYFSGGKPVPCTSVNLTAASANKLNTDAGGASTPIYFSGGKPVPCTSVNLTAASANKLNTDAGGASTPIYFSGGKPVPCTSVAAATATTADRAKKVLNLSGQIGQIGNSSRFVYVNSNGYVTASTNTVGSNTKPIYMKGGTLTASTGSVVWLSNGVLTIDI